MSPAEFGFYTLLGMLVLISAAALVRIVQQVYWTWRAKRAVRRFIG